MFRPVLFALLLLIPFNAWAGASDCTLVVGYPSGAVIKKDGDCETRHAPASTFKIPLALMGFDSHILADQHNPTWVFLPGYTDNKPDDEQATDPTSWEKNSVVWYSQKLTAQMGMEKFQAYVNQFDYGNKDVSGGLDKAWLMTSLEISPAEQVNFIRKIFDQQLGVNINAYGMTRAIMPEFTSKSGWTVHGKTGTGTLPDGKTAQGWFVGWADKNGARVLFAKLQFVKADPKNPAGPQVRDAFLSGL